jgi:ABC-type transport system involved in cytochrome bd biosynthesis fused ATPase/permease subunit
MLSWVSGSCSQKLNLPIILQILCLDECTANVDNQTAHLLQNTISAECKGMTVLTIAHRISTVMKMDNILVLDQGKLVSCAIMFLLLLSCKIT